jgi:hypothetical protein
MSANSRSLPGGWNAPGAGFASAGGEVEVQANQFSSETARGHEGGGNGGGRSKKRRRQRAQRSKRRQPPSGPGGRFDAVSRESMFQDVEGLLRQIRERAEETAEWSAEQLNDFTQTVTGFMRSLEEESEQISDRVRSEYQRVRERLSQVLKG